MWGWIFVRENSESVLECLRAKFENRRWLQSATRAPHASDTMSYHSSVAKGALALDISPADFM